MSDHGDIQNLWSPSHDLFNDVSYVGLSETFTISTCLRFRVWHGLVSPEGVGSWWYSESVISKSRLFQWCNICEFFLKFYNLHMFKPLLIVLKTLNSVNSIFFWFFKSSKFPKILKHVKITKSTNFWATEKYKIPWESFWKALSNDDFFKNINGNLTIEKP